MNEHASLYEYWRKLLMEEQQNEERNHWLMRKLDEIEQRTSLLSERSDRLRQLRVSVCTYCTCTTRLLLIGCSENVPVSHLPPHSPSPFEPRGQPGYMQLYRFCAFVVCRIFYTQSMSP
ncbi:hypothetical protein HPB48_016595 [Haemaphysalis longicornis]|uniref:Uncharacterized protein n=1 Tax=Haemaphysalis longicornis TaxID=44386 RepID=A0A9J6GEB4_HAELO|nr:hypothetical protein HPB48_016595 [Haemaphysalis longicornis]